MRIYLNDGFAGGLNYTESEGEKLRVYCAGPLFNTADRNEMGNIGVALGYYQQSSVFDTFLPHEDGMEYMGLIESLIEKGLARKHAQELMDRVIFAMDTYQILISDAMVINLNGRVADEGACMELGLAFSSGMPIVGFKDDIRSAAFGVDNPMLTMALNLDIVDEYHKIPNALQRKVEEYSSGSEKRGFFLQPHSYLARVFDYGQRFFSFDNQDDLFMNIYNDRKEIMHGYCYPAKTKVS